MTAIVRMSGVTKRYGSVTALDEVSVELAENQIHGLLGRNGAGKTTIMQILTGQGFETSGGVEVFGAHPYENDTVLSRICFVKESQRYPDWFNVRHALAGTGVLIVGLGLLANLLGWWSAMGRFVADQSTFTLVAGYPLVLAVLMAGAGYLTIRRATP